MANWWGQLVRSGTPRAPPAGVSPPICQLMFAFRIETARSLIFASSRWKVRKFAISPRSLPKFHFLNENGVFRCTLEQCFTVIVPELPRNVSTSVRLISRKFFIFFLNENGVFWCTLECCFKVIVPPTEGLAPDVHALCLCPFLMFYRTHVLHLCSDSNRCTRNS